MASIVVGMITFVDSRPLEPPVRVSVEVIEQSKQWCPGIITVVVNLDSNALSP
jgi:hypothetical protein